ncbi:MarR family winged helix-turn-helix transcriptional regulator [Marinitenerispora sediminis]|uniref:MarR family transcriptional regulator n=1 Tax=Marinitenerispora sediminis TaxID=1931232 RepID=A0A368SYL7_9ACTN|nr:MarR family transcriptional regulator [Marinitenerispora sediminis]RCV47666.1 MarR family transcriptional regulator [Marinitenerispora sediminis]RCV48089.1 MarR family transcriptional regulator [Marinitenerispora sediminis]RCV49537.1 MarR family transcriptional regulator [Marinitenerispora sediminis]
MTDETAAPGGLTFWSFVDHAVRRAQQELPAVDAEAMRLVLTLHRATSMIVYDLESTVHRPSGWTWPGFRVLFVVWLAGPMDAKSAAALTGMSRAAVSALVNTLQKDGLVTRQRADHDRRAVQISLTDTGRAAITRGFAAHNTREGAWAAALSAEERAALVALLGKLMAGDAAAAAKRRV